MVLDLVEQLQHTDSIMRENAAYLLGEISQEAKMVSEDTLKPHASLIDINAMNDSKIRMLVLAALTAKLSDKDAWVRGNSADALGKIGDPESAAALVPLVSDKEQVVRYSAIESLARIGTAETVEACIGALSDSDWSVRLCAAKYLKSSPDKRAESALKLTLKDENKDVREYSMAALAQLS